MSRELSPQQQADLEDHQARQNRAYIRDNSDTLEELKAAERTLRDRGIDPGTGRRS